MSVRVVPITPAQPSWLVEDGGDMHGPWMALAFAFPASKNIEDFDADDPSDFRVCLAAPWGLCWFTSADVYFEQEEARRAWLEYREKVTQPPTPNAIAPLSVG